jgi:hypothetical protein
MPTPFSKADVQKLADCSTPDEVEGLLKDHGYDVEGSEASGEADGEKPATTSEPDSPSPPPFKSGVNPFEKRRDVAKKAMAKNGFGDQQAND